MYLDILRVPAAIMKISLFPLMQFSATKFRWVFLSHL